MLSSLVWTRSVKVTKLSSSLTNKNLPWESLIVTHPQKKSFIQQTLGSFKKILYNKDCESTIESPRKKSDPSLTQSTWNLWCFFQLVWLFASNSANDGRLLSHPKIDHHWQASRRKPLIRSWALMILDVDWKNTSPLTRKTKTKSFSDSVVTSSLKLTSLMEKTQSAQLIIPSQKVRNLGFFSAVSDEG